MSVILLPDKWRRQPTGSVSLDTAHCLAQNPIFVHQFGAGGADASGKGIHATAGGLLTPTPDGVAVSGAAVIPGEFVVPAGDFTAFARFRTTDSIGAILSLRSSVDNPIIDLCVGENGVINDSSRAIATIRDNSGNLGYSAKLESAVVADGLWHTYALIRSGGLSYVSLDGSALTALTGANPSTGAITFSGSPFRAYLNELRNGIVGALTGQVTLGALFLRAWTAPELREIHRAPWQIFRKQPRILYFTAPSGGGASISGALESISLATFGATVASARDIAAALESVALTTSTARVSTDRAVTAAVESITISTSAATVSSDRAIAGAVESVALTTNPATVALGATIGAATEAVSLTTNAATVALDASVAATLEAITVTGLSATVSAGSDNNISATLESITVTVNPATVSRDSALAAALESLTVTPHAASIAVGQIVAAALESLTLTSYPAGIALDVAVAAQIEQINLATFAAQVGLGTNVAALTEALTLTPHGATLTFAPSVGAARESITVTTFTASVIGGESILTTPGLEFTIPLNRLGYTIPIGRIHFTIPQE